LKTRALHRKKMLDVRTARENPFQIDPLALDVDPDI
jgi:hypothetical protein